MRMLGSALYAQLYCAYIAASEAYTAQVDQHGPFAQDREVFTDVSQLLLPLARNDAPTMVAFAFSSRFTHSRQMRGLLFDRTSFIYTRRTNAFCAFLERTYPCRRNVNTGFRSLEAIARRPRSLEKPTLKDPEEDLLDILVTAGLLASR